MKRLIKIGGQIFIFCFLTILTQIGGLVFLISLVFNKKWKVNFKFKPLLTFFLLYLFFTFLIIPFVAPIFGREKVKHSEKIKPANYLTVLLNRNYVDPDLNNLLANTEKTLVNSNVEINYLDANFPFINKFPLLPHLSHNDGEKIDVSLIYEDGNKEVTNKQKSISGYGVFEGPKNGEHNQTSFCKNKGYFQYDYPKYLTFGKINAELLFSEAGTKELLLGILQNKNLGKIFIELHLKKRLSLFDNRIRYQGCRAVRHDDHIHIQLK